MFERYDEDARRALFYARFEVTQTGGLSIEPEHLVAGILRGTPQAVLQFTAEGTKAGSLRAALADASVGGENLSSSIEIPFSAACKAALQRTAIEANDAGNRTIRCEHLLLGVLATTSGQASRILHESGVRIEAIREFLKAQPREGPPPPEPAPRVARYWKGVTTAANADAYIAHLERETFPALARLGGFAYASIQTRPILDGVEFLIMTVWRSLDDITAFAGEDVETAVVPPAAQALLSRYDSRAVHYEIVNSRG